MGLLQKACETYDAMAGRVGIMYEKEKEPLAPISHMMARPQIKITLDQNGNFITAQALEKDVPKIIIPATEESAGRSRLLNFPTPYAITCGICCPKTKWSTATMCHSCPHGSIHPFRIQNCTPS